ncbi:polyprenyl synthetase family protein [Streptomyces sp. t39]|nr:polyprenyl synthetase family protein [Streptomyces sp. t39]
MEQVLDAYLRERVAEAESVDPLFAREVAGRVQSLVLRGGKRLRARFAWWGWRAGGGSEQGRGARAALRLGSALELIQACALIHDDVMDDSSLRRGAPTLHVDFADVHAAAGMRGDHGGYGRAAAILAGDLALSWADDLAAETGAECATQQPLLAVWRRMRQEMVAGQYLDMRAQASSSTPGQALRIAFLKTALYTVERPLALGAALAGMDARDAAALCAAGRCAGVAFQLRDDLLGVFGDPALTGKPSGEDIRSGKPTYLTAVARARLERSGDTSSLRLLHRAVGDPGLGEADLRRVRDVLEGSGARSATEAEIDRLVRRSREHLMRVPLSAPVDRHLFDLLGTAVGRAQVGGGDRAAPGRPARHEEGTTPVRGEHT